MGLRVVAALAAACVVVAAVVRPRERPSMASRTSAAKSANVENTSRVFLNFVLLPTWVAAGFLDYLCHRRAKIERTSGTHESITHMLMICSTGVGVTTAMFFETNELTLVIMTGAAVVHEAILAWDLAYAARVRPPSASEQHVHSFLEVLPFTGLAFSFCLNPDEVAALLGRAKHPPHFVLAPKQHPLSPFYNVVVITIVTLGLFIPYTEELVRCYRTDRTIFPHNPST